jgi:hypothetical protein
MAQNGFSLHSCSVSSWTTVSPDVSITFRFSECIDARSAQSGIRIVSAAVRADVVLDDDAIAATWTPLSPLPDGEHTLRVEGVAALNGKHAIAPWELHFHVVRSGGADRPYGQVVLHRSTTKLRMSQRQYSISKILDPESGTRSTIAVNEHGETYDLKALVLEDRSATLAKYGKIHPALHVEIESRSDDDRVAVGIWATMQEDFVDKSRFDIDPCGEAPDCLVGYRERIRKGLSSLSQLIMHRYECPAPRALRAAPLLLAELTPPQIREVAEWRGVSALFLHEREGIEDIRDSMKISGANELVNVEGWRATGVRVGVWENGADDTSQLVIQAQFSSTPETRQHTRLVTGIIRNTQLAFQTTLDGHRDALCYAPRCRIYAANTMDVAALQWAVIDHECRVINQSFHWTSEAAGSDESLDDVLKDYMVLHYPYPTIVQAAGNFWATDRDAIMPPSSEYVNHKGFNSISVGNHDDTASAMDGSSVFRNPNTAHGDRELPEICANGTAVTAVGVTTENTGTSFASPAVAGSVALLQQIDSTLASWPEGSRAILFASAVNVTGRTWARDLRAGVDASDGAGALDAGEAARIARHRTTLDNHGEQRGWDVGTFYPEQFDGEGDWRHAYRIHIPAFGTVARVKVALAWDRMGTESTSSGPGLVASIWLATVPNDYDLYVYDEQGAMIAWSASWDNSYEIAEFTGTPGRTYTVRVTKASGDEASYYGIAWSVRDRSFLSSTTTGPLTSREAARG